MTFPIVQQLFQRYAAGESIWVLAKWFKEQTGKGRRNAGISRMLAEPYYCGIYLYNRHRNSKIDGQYAKPRDEWVVTAHPYPAVTMEVFQAVQDRLALRANVGQERATEPQYPLAGILWCAGCKKRMHGRPDASRRYPFYHCPYCGLSKSVRKLDAVVQGLLAQIPVGVDAVAAMATAAQRAQQSDVGDRRAEVAARIAKLHARRARLTVQYGDKEIAKADYDAALTLTDDELGTLHNELARLPDGGAPSVSAVETARWLQGIPGWHALLADMDVADVNHIYRHAIVACTLDFATQALAVRYVFGVAYLLGRGQDVVQLSGNHLHGAVAF